MVLFILKYRFSDFKVTEMYLTSNFFFFFSCKYCNSCPVCSFFKMAILPPKRCFFKLLCPVLNVFVFLSSRTDSVQQFGESFAGLLEETDCNVTPD